MRKATTTLVLTTALLGWATTPAFPQDVARPAASSADSAEDAFLKAYFAEKELKDYAAAEKAYAAVVAMNGASHEVLARATLGRARCLAQLKRGDESAALFAKVEKDFADIADAANEARAARQATAGTVEGPLDDRIRATLDLPTWRDEAWKFGERGVASLVNVMTTDELPERVYRAAETLGRMDVPAAYEALAAAVDSRNSKYPEQVSNAAQADFLPMKALRRLVDSKDAAVRKHALIRLAFFNDPKALATIVADPPLRASYFASNPNSENFGRALVAALAAGGEARDAALARLRGERLAPEATAAFLDPPAAVLDDAEALAAIAPMVDEMSLSIAAGSSTRHPSRELVVAFLRHPATAETGVRFTLLRKGPSADPAAFVDAVARFGFGKEYSGGNWSDAQLADALVAAFGPKPTPEILKRLAAAWPAFPDGNLNTKRLAAFLDRLIASGVTDEESLLAFQEGLPREPWQQHQVFVYALMNDRRASDPIGPWATKAFLRELARTADRDMHGVAASALSRWQNVFGDAAGLRQHLPELVAALGDGGTDDIARVLGALKPASIDALKSALPTHPHKAVVVETLVDLGDKSSGDAIERVLAESGDIERDGTRKDEVKAAAAALIMIRGPAAKDALAAALTAHDGRDARSIFEAIADSDAVAAALGDQARFELVKVAIEKAPGTVDAYPGATNHLPAESLRALAVLALGSKSVADRRWGAYEEKTLLDVAAWDALLAAAQDSDNDLRDTARDALRAIRAKENEMAEFRAMGEERATRKRIESLIASNKQDDRRAGVAAIAATGMTGMVNDLIRLAAEDKDDSVRDDARKALLAMAKPAAPVAPATQPAAEKK
jgi:hypothetical protein